MKLDRAFHFGVAPAVLGAILLASASTLMHGTVRDQAINPSYGLYDHDPNQIWNRVNSTLLVRRSPDGTENGSDSVDPLLWANSRFLRKGRSRRLALACLDEFLKTHAEEAIADPTSRAVFQHDLWAVFDWAFSVDSRSAKNQALLERLAQVMHRVALTSDQVRALPDNYAVAVASGVFPTEYDPANPQRAFLPPDLLRSDGPWICLTGYSAEPVAMEHFSGRSRFLVFLRLPGGRQATIEYLGKLLESPEPLFVEVQEGEAPTLKKLNLRLPQFPVGTEVALLRQTIVIDAEGNLEPTTLTESVQLRVYHAITSESAYINFENGPSSHDQDFFEFRLNRAALFARHGGGLQAVQRGETEFPTFSSFGIDPFEAARKNAWVKQPPEILARCRACHVDAGIHSVRSRERWLAQPPRSREGEAKPSLSRAVKWETEKTVERKQGRDDFKSLLRCWQRPE